MLTSAPSSTLVPTSRMPRAVARSRGRPPDVSTGAGSRHTATRCPASPAHGRRRRPLRPIVSEKDSDAAYAQRRDGGHDGFRATAFLRPSFLLPGPLWQYSSSNRQDGPSFGHLAGAKTSSMLTCLIDP